MAQDRKVMGGWPKDLINLELREQSQLQRVMNGGKLGPFPFPGPPLQPFPVRHWSPC